MIYIKSQGFSLLYDKSRYRLRQANSLFYCLGIASINHYFNFDYLRGIGNRRLTCSRSICSELIFQIRNFIVCSFFF